MELSFEKKTFSNGGGGAKMLRPQNHSCGCSGIAHGSKPNRLFVAIIVMTLQYALREEFLINYFFRFYLFVIKNYEIICKDLDKGLLGDINKAQFFVRDYLYYHKSN